MEKAVIYKSSLSNAWFIQEDKYSPQHLALAFDNFNAARLHFWKMSKRRIKEQSAFSKVQKIAVNLLNLEEQNFIKKLLRTKCKGITKAQYGWLAGIYERQEREW